MHNVTILKKYKFTIPSQNIFIFLILIIHENTDKSFLL